MSTVTLIQQVSKTKYRVFLDDEFAFILNAGEMLHLSVREGCEFTDAMMDEVMNRILPERGRKYLLNIISAMDRTESQIRDSMVKNGYPEEVIAETIEFGRKQRFLDDRRYASNYIDCVSSRKGEMAIRFDLRRRGIDEGLIDELLNCRDGTTEREAILTALESRHPLRELQDRKEEQKLTSYFARRGFAYNSIHEAFRSYFSNERGRF